MKYLFLIPMTLLLLTGCGSEETTRQLNPEDTEGASGQQQLENIELPKVTFSDITRESGIDFHHTNGSFGKKLLPETMGSGVVLLDFDNDGDQDVLFVNSQYWPDHEKGGNPTLELYRNDGKASFENVTAEAGLKVSLYGMGATAGDYDNDGWIDVFVTGVGGNLLFRNNMGRFEDVTEQAGVGGPGGWGRLRAGSFLDHETPLTFSTSTTFLDYDLDGGLDLFVCNYVTWSPKIDVSQSFTLTGIGRAFGPPTSFRGSQCFLYKNVGGRFKDVSRSAGIQIVDTAGANQAMTRDAGKSLGVCVFDGDEDGYPEIMVANDTVRNFLFHNVEGPNGERVFRETGLTSGVAYADGTARGAMGIDWGEYRPGRHAVLIANFSDEPNTFLRLENPKRLLFRDVARAEEIWGPSKSPLKFGAFFFDFDLDGRLDFMTANGHLEPDISKVQGGQNYEQSAQLFWNTGVSRRGFQKMTRNEIGDAFFKPIVGRGSAFGDLDGDGDPDVVMTSNGGAPLVLKNNGGSEHHWIRLKLEGDGSRCNRSAIGARVKVHVGDRILSRRIAAGRGYLSQSELPLTVGLGKNDRVNKIVIHWPTKTKEKTSLENPAVDREHVIRLR